MACKYLTVLPPIPQADFVGSYAILKRVSPCEDGREPSSFCTFRVTIENAVGGTFAYRLKTRKLATEFIEAVKTVKPISVRNFC
jgi:hypothetical protein